MHPIIVELLTNDLHARRVEAARVDRAHPLKVPGLTLVRGLLSAISPVSSTSTVDAGPKLEFGVGYPYA